MRGSSDLRPALRLVQPADAEPVEFTWFCGHCAAPARGDQPPAPMARVCRSCGLGVMLETRRDIAPSHRDAFLVIDSSLLVQAMSWRAETLLGVTEDSAVNRPVMQLLVPADAEAVSHRLTVRAGLARQVSAGLWTFLPAGWRSQLGQSLSNSEIAPSTLRRRV